MVLRPFVLLILAEVGLLGCLILEVLVLVDAQDVILCKLARVPRTLCLPHRF